MTDKGVPRWGGKGFSGVAIRGGYDVDAQIYTLELEKNPAITMKVIPGHFTTKKAHISHYLDVSTLKSNATVAREVARELAIPYLSNTPVDTIVCMENTKVIGAYLAEELLQEGTSIINSGGEINVVTPMSNVDGKLTFYESEVDWIRNKNVLLIFATISSGRTAKKALECIEYYGGRLAGITALFVYSEEKTAQTIHPLFKSSDVPGYGVFKPDECVMCIMGRKVDALISSEGFTKI
jgi:orotate phosphoribosyltransferase